MSENESVRNPKSLCWLEPFIRDENFKPLIQDSAQRPLNRIQAGKKLKKFVLSHGILTFARRWQNPLQLIQNGGKRQKYLGDKKNLKNLSKMDKPQTNA
jgi:hypothetical protein